MAMESQPNIEEMLSRVREVLDMDLAFISEFSEDRLVFRQVEGDAESFGFREGEDMPLEDSYCKRVIDERVSNVIPDATGSEGVKDLRVTREAGIGAYVSVPLRFSDGSLYGTLCCLSHAPDPWLRERELRHMGDLARRLIERLENEGML